MKRRTTKLEKLARQAASKQGAAKRKEKPEPASHSRRPGTPLPIGAFAEEYNVSTNTIRRALAAGRLSYTMVGARRFIFRPEVHKGADVD